MKIDKIRELDEKEIVQQLNEAGEQAFRLRFQLSMGQTDGIKKLRTLRKDRARMLTVLAERKAKGDQPSVAVPVTEEKAKAVKPKATKKAAAPKAKKVAAKPKAAGEEK